MFDSHIQGYGLTRMPQFATLLTNQSLTCMILPKLFCPAEKAAAHKRERRKDARPGELLAAALDLFVEKGFAGTRAEEVAQRAGVSKGTLFLYFSSKEELFKAVVRDSISDRFPKWTAELDAFGGSTADMLRKCMLGWWNGVGDTKASGISKLMMSEAGNFPELSSFYRQEVIEPGKALIRRILQRGVDRGEFRAVDLNHAVHAVLAPLLFITIWKHSLGASAENTPALVPEEFLATQVDIILNGMCNANGTALAHADNRFQTKTTG